MQITTDLIRQLRARTGAGIMDSKRALESTNGDLERAEEILRDAGVAQAVAKADRPTTEGLVDAYVHAGSRIGALVELSCETDFVARTEKFRSLAHNLAMQVAAMAPIYLDREEMTADDPRKPEEVCLLQQPFIRDTSKTILELVMDVRARVGENVRVRRFARFSLGD